MVPVTTDVVLVAQFNSVEIWDYPKSCAAGRQHEHQVHRAQAHWRTPLLISFALFQGVSILF